MAVSVERLARVAVNSANPEMLAAFYAEAFGFERVRASPAGTFALSLGDTRLDLRQANGKPYPGDVPGWSPLFQHCAIVASDMGTAIERLNAVRGWRAITIDGPQLLPPQSGGVVAFKFRDPEGHPLELLYFPDVVWAQPPAAPCLRIDHSAISVAATARSVAFYTELGLKIGARTLNLGPEQDKLDDIAKADVEVTALDLADHSAPHVELLCYRGAYDRAVPPMHPDDIAATRLVFAVAGPQALRAICARHSSPLIERPSSTATHAALQDPDGHIVELETA